MTFINNTNMENGKKTERNKQRRHRKRTLAKQTNAGTNKHAGNTSASSAPARRSPIGTSAAFKGFSNVPMEVYGAFALSSDKVDRIIACITLPDQAESLRIANGFNASRTAVGSDFDRLKAPWTTGTEDDTLLAFAQRIAECSQIVLMQAVNETVGPAELYQYDMYTVPSAPGFEDDPPGQTATIFCAAQKTYLNSPYAVPQTGFDFTPHGPIWFAGGLSNAPGSWFWCEAGSQVNLKMTNLTGAEIETVQMHLDRWTASQGLQQSEEQDAISALANNDQGHMFVSVSKAGYYCISAISSTAGPVLVQAYIVGPTVDAAATDKCWGHRCMPEFGDYAGKSVGIAITGLALMYSNTAAPGYRSGNTVSFQIPKGQHWLDYQTYDDLFNAEGAVPLPAENGCYTPLKPSDSADLELKSYSKARNGVIRASFWPIDGGRAVIATAVKVEMVTNAPNPRDGYWTWLYNHHFETASKWFAKDYSEFTTIEVQTAFDRLRTVPSTVENPSHFAKMMKAIRTVGAHTIKGVNKYGPRAVRAAQTSMKVAQQLEPFFV